MAGHAWNRTSIAGFPAPRREASPAAACRQVDTSQTVFDSPVNLFVAVFIGSPAMNFVAELVREDGPAVTFAGSSCPRPFEDDAGDTGLVAADRTALPHPPETGEFGMLVRRYGNRPAGGSARSRTTPTGEVPLRQANIRPARR